MTDKLRVHFIDDDPTAGDLFRRFSRGRPYDIGIFRDPLEALDDIRESIEELEYYRKHFFRFPQQV